MTSSISMMSDNENTRHTIRKEDPLNNLVLPALKRRLIHNSLIGTASRSASASDVTAHKRKRKPIMDTLIKLICVAVLVGVGSLTHVQAQYPQNIIVAQDGSGNFTTIQAAINATRDLSQVQVNIFIRPGLYFEKVVVPSWKSRISLIGLTPDPGTVVISGDDHTGKPLPGDGCWDPTGSGVYKTFTSYTLLVAGAEFQAVNLTIENVAGRVGVGQAVALHVEGDRAIIRNCRLLGNQDTLYAAVQDSRQYYVDSYIEGTTDFIFGEATAVFDRCTIKSLSNSYITAASTPPHQRYGFVFRNCSLIADPEATRVYLGRPWRPYARTVFLNTRMGSHIVPAGWHNWDDPTNEETAFYAEYETEGVDVSQRVDWSRQLTATQAAEYENIDVIFGRVNWWVPPVMDTEPLVM